MATLTITIDDETAAAVERITTREGTNLETLFRHYLNVLSAGARPIDRASLPPLTRQALGIGKGVPDRPYKELLGEAIEDRYGDRK